MLGADKLDKANIEQLFTLLFDLHLEFWPEVPQGLFERLSSSLILSQCVTNYGSTLGISTYVHAKTSLSSFKRSRNAYFKSADQHC